MNNWQLDQQYLRSCIKKGKDLLKKQNLSKKEKECISENIETFKRFLIGDFENYETSLIKHNISLEKLRKYILHKMKKQYEMFGEELIDFIITLDEERILEPRTIGFDDRSDLSIDLQAELTLRNYGETAKCLVELVKRLLYSSSTSQIQSSNELNSSSYYYYSCIADLPFLIINPTEAPWILNHEIQHAIEKILGYHTHNIFTELGPIYFELLFTDLLFKEQNFILAGDYMHRLDEVLLQSSCLANYFTIMQIFSADKFQVPMDKFQDTFLEYVGTTPKDLEAYLCEEILSDELEFDMCYLLSYLKAIELREQTKSYPGDSFDILVPYLKSRKFNFKPTKDSFKIYEAYIEEMEQKSKKIGIY